MSAFITIYVGWKCYVHGFAYLQFLIKDWAICMAINRLLLLGYYLLNMGYIAWSLNSWGRIFTYEQMFATLGEKIGLIIIILCFLHYVNILSVYFLSKLFFKTKTL